MEKEGKSRLEQRIQAKSQAKLHHLARPVSQSLGPVSQAAMHQSSPAQQLHNLQGTRHPATQAQQAQLSSCLATSLPVACLISQKAEQYHPGITSLQNNNNNRPSDSCQTYTWLSHLSTNLELPTLSALTSESHRNSILFPYHPDLFQSCISLQQAEQWLTLWE